MADQTATAPVLPEIPRGYFDNAASRQDHWQKTLAAFETAQPASASPAPGAAPAVAPNADDLRTLELTGQTKLASGMAACLDPRAGRVIEKHRAAVLEGKPLDRAAAKAELAAALGLPAPVVPKVEAPTPPEGSPEDRAFAEASARLDTGDVIPVDELPAEMLSGYEVDLPEGFGLTGESVGMLATARAAGIPQSVVNKFIRARIAQESEE